MTIEICLDYCKSKGTTYAGIEYRRECYCGNSIASDATPNAAGCNLPCKGDPTEICGGSNVMNVYQYVSGTEGSSTATSSTSSLASSSTTPASSSSSSSSASSTSTSVSQTSTDSSTTSTASTTSKASSTTPSSTTATTTTSSQPSTLTTSTRTTYITPTPSATATPTQGFYSLGCYAEPPAPTKKPMTQLLASDNMSPEVCIAAVSSANNKPGATNTYQVFGLEYGRECYAATALVQSQTSLTGDGACNIACVGDKSVSCGGRGMYNYYVATDLTASLTTTSVPVRASGTVKR
ncbi:MAG: hypothetical protein Q9182_002745 [Xanthomendoza sp. 2 TL-2023]